MSRRLINDKLFQYYSKCDNSDPHEIIPISFNMHQVLHKNYCDTEKYLVQTRFQAKSSGIKLPEVHGMGKNLDPSIKPEKQHANPIKDSVVKPHIGQGRAGLKRKKNRSNQSNNQSAIKTVTENSWRNQNRNRKIKPNTFLRSNAFHKQYG